MQDAEVESGAAKKVIANLDPFSSAAISNGTQTNEEIRRAGDVIWLERYGLWATGRFDPASRILNDWEHFSSAERPFLHPDFPLPAILVTDNPPTHGPTRSVMNRIMSPKHLRHNESVYTEAAYSMLERVLGQDEFDGAGDLAIPYVLKVFGDVVGLPNEGRQNLVPFGAAILNTFGPANELFMSLVQEAAEATVWVKSQCCKESLKAGGLGAAIYEASERGEVTEAEADLLVLSLLSAGTDTTSGSIVNLLHAFARHPGQYALLRQRPELRTRALEELLRYHSPARVFGRVAHCDTELYGQHIKQGDGLLVFLASAGRDRSIWPDADCFDITRQPGRHIAFGTGIHNCVGQMLARAEIMAFLSILIEKVERMEMCGEPTVMISNTISSYSRIPLKFIGN